MKKLITIIPVSSFDNSKTRLSPFLSISERSELLKYMLKDIISNIKNCVSDIFIISKDTAVLEYAKSLDLHVLREQEHKDNFLNNSLIDAINYIKKSYDGANILILPSDIPLITRKNIEYIDKNCDNCIICPSKGGGTNLLYIKDKYDFIPLFGEFSFFKHVTEAKNKNMDVNIYDSFYLSIDINTPQDLGEILLHGKNTYTYAYLDNLDIIVENKHGQERLNVYRKNE